MIHFCQQNLPYKFEQNQTSPVNRTLDFKKALKHKVFDVSKQVKTGLKNTKTDKNRQKPAKNVFKPT